MDWRDHISIDPNVCHGKACVAGTRILASIVLDNLAAGEAADTIIEQYPGVTPEAIRACLAYASDLAQDRHLDVPA